MFPFLTVFPIVAVRQLMLEGYCLRQLYFKAWTSRRHLATVYIWVYLCKLEGLRQCNKKCPPGTGQAGTQLLKSYTDKWHDISVYDVID